MLSSKPLLRFKDLNRVGINDWPTLKRRITQDNFPPGRYVGENTRVWTEEEVGEWWVTRPSAAPPENVKPATPVCSRGSGRASNDPFFTPGYSELAESPQPPAKRRRARDGVA